MTYKKYIKRNGKVYGPYLYESKRINGKVVSEYIGQGKKKEKRKRKNLPYLLIPIILGFAFFIIFSGSSSHTGKAILSLNTINSSNTYTGNITLNLLKGELIPAESIIKIKNSNKTYSFQINQLLNEKPTNGTYYSNQVSLLGSGKGYGERGIKSIPETVFFKIKLISKNQSQINSTTNKKNNSIISQINSTKINQTNITLNHSNISLNKSTNFTQITSSQINSTTNKKNNSIISQINSTKINQTNITQNSSNFLINNSFLIRKNSSINNSENQNESQGDFSVQKHPNKTIIPKVLQKNLTSPPKPSNSTITGKAVSPKTNPNNLFNKILGFFYKFSKQTGNVIKNNQIIQADTKIGDPFVYNLPSNTIAVLVPGSVSTQTNSLPDNSISLNTNSGKLIVTTNYSQIKEGFGKDFLENETVPYVINLNKESINLLPGKVTITLESQNKTILIFKQIVEHTALNFTNLTQKIFNSSQVNFSENSLSPREQKILENQFGKNYTVLTNASKYRNKIIVDFTLGEYSVSNTYSDNLTNEKLKLYMNRDKLIWLKDIVNSFFLYPQEIPLKNLSI